MEISCLILLKLYDTFVVMKSAHIYIKGNYIEIQADWSLMSLLGLLKMLEGKHGFTSVWDARRQTYIIPIVCLKEFEDTIKVDTTVFLHNAAAVPAEPGVLRVEYIGACRKRTQQQSYRGLGTQGLCYGCQGTGQRNRMTSGFNASTCNVCGGSGYLDGRNTEPLSYATAWVNDGWNVQFPETVLRKYFPETPHFDGDFHKALLTGDELSKIYKKLSLRFHPDVKGGSHEMFIKLRKAFDDLSDPQRRKRYRAGLKFADATSTEKPQFRVPKTCGDVTVTLEDSSGDGVMVVKEILSWKDVFDSSGRVMSSKFVDIWRYPPFDVSWDYTGEFVVEI